MWKNPEEQKQEAGGDEKTARVGDVEASKAGDSRRLSEGKSCTFFSNITVCVYYFGYRFFHFDNLIKGNDFKCVFSPENGQILLKSFLVLPSSFDKEK